MCCLDWPISIGLWFRRLIYVVVVFSALVHGTTFSWLLEKIMPASGSGNIRKTSFS